MSLILASGSPRRKELLSFITNDFIVRVSDVDENTDPSLSPELTVQKLAGLKGDAVFELSDCNDVIIASDTVVFKDGKILGKPKDRREAFLMLSELSACVHTVYTGVYIRQGEKSVSFCETTQVEFYRLTNDEINAYIDTGEPFDKAGGYGIQGPGALLVKDIRGDFYNVMGFPVARVYRELKKFGI